MSNAKEAISRRKFLQISGEAVAGLALLDTPVLGGLIELLNKKESTISGDLFKLRNFPSSVDNKDIRFAEKSPFANEEFNVSVGEPGVYTTSDPDSKDLVSNDNPNGSAYLLEEAQEELNDEESESHHVEEGRGSTMLTGAAFRIELSSGQVLDFDAKENHTWIVILRGKETDGETPKDKNVKAKISNYNPGFVLRTYLPPGMFVSANYLSQNVETAITRDNCGRNGCAEVSVAIAELEEGTVTVARTTKESEGKDWEVLAKNWEKPETDEE